MADSGRFSIIPARAFDDRRMGGGPLRVLGLLGTYSNRDGWSWPAVTTLAARLEISRQAIQAHMRDLQSWGYILVQEQLGRVNRYRILHDVDLPEEFDRLAIATRQPELAPRGQAELACQPELGGGGQPELGTNVPIEQTQKTKIKGESSTLLSAKADDHKAMIRIWIEELPNLPKPRGCTDQRRRKLQQRLKEFFQGEMDHWRDTCRKIASCPHLMGDNDRGWTANLDWVLEPRNLTKILEGNYDARQPVERKPQAEGVLEIGRRYLQRQAEARDRRGNPPLDEHAEEPGPTEKPGAAAVAVLPDGREVPLHGTAADGGPVDRGEPMVPGGGKGLRGRATNGARPCDSADREPSLALAVDPDVIDPDLRSTVGRVVSARVWPSADETTPPARKPGDGHGSA